MIVGLVKKREAVIPLTVHGSGGHNLEIEAVVANRA